MKKGDIIKLFRETEEKLFGYPSEILELNERIDDHMIQEATLKKTINELNESNKKLMDKVKFYQQQKEKNKKRDNKIEDYINKGLIEKIEGLQEENKQFQGEIVRLEELSKQRFFENEKLSSELKNLNETFELGSKCAEDVHHNLCKKIKSLEKEKEELIEECKDKNKWNEKLQGHHDFSNERMGIYMTYLHDMETAINNLRITDEELLKAHK
tara:strand:- start:6474 stop:7112 length:639 start_codon:yes stop_codon:yes gene_type:complete